MKNKDRYEKLEAVIKIDSYGCKIIESDSAKGRRITLIDKSPNGSYSIANEVSYPKWMSSEDIKREQLRAMGLVRSLGAY